MTNKNHFIAALIFGLTTTEAAIVTTPDSIRCWLPERAVTHFTINPQTGDVSGMKFPDFDVKLWTETIVQMVWAQSGYYAGKPGEACIDEATIPNAFWIFNEHNEQNNLFFMHLIQDRLYDSFIRSVIDCSRRYEDIYVFNDKEYSGADLRGKGMARWNGDGLLNQLDSQFFVRLAKVYWKKTSELADASWIQRVMKTAIFEAYSKELAEKTCDFISIDPLAHKIISEGRFDEEIWSVPNSLVDRWVERLFEDTFDSQIR